MARHACARSRPSPPHPEPPRSRQSRRTQRSGARRPRSPHTQPRVLDLIVGRSHHVQHRAIPASLQHPTRQASHTPSRPRNRPGVETANNGLAQAETDAAAAKQDAADARNAPDKQGRGEPGEGRAQVPVQGRGRGRGRERLCEGLDRGVRRLIRGRQRKRSGRDRCVKDLQAVAAGCKDAPARSDHRIPARVMPGGAAAYVRRPVHGEVRAWLRAEDERPRRGVPRHRRDGRRRHLRAARRGGAVPGAAVWLSFLLAGDRGNAARLHGRQARRAVSRRTAGSSPT